MSYLKELLPKTLRRVKSMSTFWSTPRLSRPGIVDDASPQQGCGEGLFDRVSLLPLREENEEPGSCSRGCHVHMKQALVTSYDACMGGA